MNVNNNSNTARTATATALASHESPAVCAASAHESHSALDALLWLMSIAAVIAIIFLCACSAAPASKSGDTSKSGAAGSSSSSASQNATQGQSGQYTPAADDVYAKGTHHATIQVAGQGEIQLELYADKAPISVSNFCHLAKAGFYNGLTFHRIINGFMMQGGDPKGDGTGGSTQTIKGEFVENGVVNPLQHKRGTISMARSNEFDSASSQFFIMQKDNNDLDGHYAAFGSVTKGMEIVDVLCKNTPVQDNNGTVAPKDQPKITSITISD